MIRSVAAIVALLKAALFLAALVLAALNNFDLTARLARAEAASAERGLRSSVTAELALGLAIVLASGWLASLMPGADQHALTWDWQPVLLGLGLLALVAIAAVIWLRRPGFSLHHMWGRS